jgi:hypothetical protein
MTARIAIWRGFRLSLSVLLLCLPGAAFAGKVRLADSSGGSSGSTLEVSFNPTAVAVVQPQETVMSMLMDLATQINAVSVGVYLAQVTDPVTLDIRRTGGEEIDDLHFVENDRIIQSVTLTLDRPQLVAEIGDISQPPTFGAITVSLNDRRIVVGTAGKGSAATVNAALVQAIAAAGFQVDDAPPVIIVRRDLRFNTGLTLLGLQSTDPAIFLSDLALVPDPNAAP